MPTESIPTEELEQELSIQRSGTDRHQAAKVGAVNTDPPYFDPNKPPAEPAEEPPAEPPKPESVLRHP